MRNFSKDRSLNVKLTLFSSQKITWLEIRLLHLGTKDGTNWYFTWDSDIILGRRSRRNLKHEPTEFSTNFAGTAWYAGTGIFLWYKEWSMQTCHVWMEQGLSYFRMCVRGRPKKCKAAEENYYMNQLRMEGVGCVGEQVNQEEEISERKR
jgi:hypothetical protein